MSRLSSLEKRTYERAGLRSVRINGNYDFFDGNLDGSLVFLHGHDHLLPFLVRFGVYTKGSRTVT